MGPGAAHFLRVCLHHLQIRHHREPVRFILNQTGSNSLCFRLSFRANKFARENRIPNTKLRLRVFPDKRESERSTRSGEKVAARLIEASARIAVCGQPQVSTQMIRSSGSVVLPEPGGPPMPMRKGHGWSRQGGRGSSGKNPRLLEFVAHRGDVAADGGTAEIIERCPRPFGKTGTKRHAFLPALRRRGQRQLVDINHGPGGAIGDQDGVVPAGTMADEVADPVEQGPGIGDPAFCNRPFRPVRSGKGACRKGGRQEIQEQVVRLNRHSRPHHRHRCCGDAACRVRAGVRAHAGAHGFRSGNNHARNRSPDDRPRARV